MAINLKDELRVALMAIKEACREILYVYGSKAVSTEIKNDNTPLTIADKRANGVITSILKRHFSYPIISEEGEEVLYSTRQHWENFWLIDPLDGTKEFIKRNGEFTVNIALIAKSVPVLGVVAVPVTGEIYYSTQGKGAFIVKDGNITKLPKRKSVDINQHGLRVVASRSHMNDQTESFISQLYEPNLISAGSSLKFILVAKGEADIYPRFIPSMEWDIAASHVIIREVGLNIKNAFNNEPLVYNKENLINPYFICQ